MDFGLLGNGLVANRKEGLVHVLVKVQWVAGYGSSYGRTREGLDMSLQLLNSPKLYPIRVVYTVYM